MPYEVLHFSGKQKTRARRIAPARLCYGLLTD